MRGVTFAAQTFFTKLNGAIAAAVSVLPDSDRFQRGEGASFRRQDLPINCGPFSCLGSIIGESARCSSCTCTNSTTMMFSSCPSAAMVRSPAKGSGSTDDQSVLSHLYVNHLRLRSTFSCIPPKNPISIRIPDFGGFLPMIPLDDLIGCFSFCTGEQHKIIVLLNFGGKLQHMNG